MFALLAAWCASFFYGTTGANGGLSKMMMQLSLGGRQLLAPDLRIHFYVGQSCLGDGLESMPASGSARGRGLIFEALGNLGDFVGGLAVIVTIFYLAYQLRQNTNALERASRQETQSEFRVFNRIFLDPDVAAAFAAGIRCYSDLPFEQRALFNSLSHELMLFFMGAFAQHETGALEEATFQSYRSFVSAWAATPGGGDWWEESKLFYITPMVESVDARLAEGGLPDLRNFRGWSP